MTEGEKLVGGATALGYLILMGILFDEFGLYDVGIFGIILAFAGLIAVEVIAFRVFNSLRTKCPKCGIYGALEVVEQEMYRVRDTTMKEETPIKNSRGEKIGSYEQDVAATEYTKKQYLKCKYCGYKTESYRIERYKKY